MRKPNRIDLRVSSTVQTALEKFDQYIADIENDTG